MKLNPIHILHFGLLCFSLIILGCTPALSQSEVELKPWGQSFDQPIDLIPWIDDDFILIEKAGKVKTIDQDGNQLAEILDISDLIARDGGERGLLGIAIHPGYPDTPYIYLNHTNESNNTAVVRYVFDPESTSIDPSTRKVLLRVDQPYSNHNGGCIVFGPDGYLYIGMGDGGSAGDPENRAQDLLSLLGKMLRIDVDNGDPYVIPEDNPFKDLDNAQPEIWSYGWRNPWRFSFDRMTGDMWVGDVGQNAVEEVSFEKADTTGGLNYGWRCFEGDEAYDQSGECDGPFVGPMITRDHSTGDRSITGGYRYRGPVEELHDRYFFADYVSGNIYMAFLSDSDEDFPEVDSISTIDNKNSIASFAQDKEGNLYALSLSGQIYKFFLTCETSVPELRENASIADSVWLETDSSYQQYIWYYNQESDQKSDFTAVDTTDHNAFSPQESGNYYVTVIDSNGCRGDSDILSFVLSSSNAVEFYDINIFPNPATNYLTIRTAEALSGASIEIRDSRGQLMRKVRAALPGSISLHNLPTGMYFLKFLAGQKAYVTKIFKD